MKRPRRSLWRPLAVLGTGFFAAAGCGPGAEAELTSLLDARVAAINQRDPAAFFSGYSPAFADEDYPAPEGREKVAARLASPPPLRASVLQRKLDFSAARAVAREEIYLEGPVEGKPRRYQEWQWVQLVREAEGWRIVADHGFYRLMAGRVEEEDRVSEALAARERALAAKDLELYLSVVSPDYRSQGRGPAEVRDKVAGIFADYEAIRYELLDRRLRLHGGRATAVQAFRLRAQSGGAPLTLEDRERLELVRRGEHWQIVRGL